MITFPSPQVSAQLLAVELSPPDHVYPVSTEQVELQPSPLAVFPSSQYPAAIFMTKPSPHISDQELAVVLVPKEQEYPVSTDQLELHPSPLAVFPSSQYPVVGLITIPSPQVSAQLLAVVLSPPDHVYPVSTEQDELQPSLLTVFPSSQYPEATFITNPSPQISEHELAVVLLPLVQVYPVSTDQVELQPSPFIVPPSSQYPEAIFMTFPSPHISEQLLAVDAFPPEQVYPVSTEQVEDHPSPDIVLLSSQYPVAMFITNPSPQISDHELAVVLLPEVHE